MTGIVHYCMVVEVQDGHGMGGNCINCKCM